MEGETLAVGKTGWNSSLALHRDLPNTLINSIDSCVGKSTSLMSFDVVAVYLSFRNETVLEYNYSDTLWL